jgi:exopolysaccharide biosynthesis polyprenyl glycosylphosphotransferase
MVVRADTAAPEQIAESTAQLPMIDAALPKRYTRIVRGAVLDALALTLAAVAAMLGGTYGYWPSPSLWMAVFCAVSLLLYASGGAYRWRLRLDVLEDAKLVLKQTTLAALAILAASTTLGPDSLSPPALFRLWLFATVFVTINRMAAAVDERRSRRMRASLRPTLIVGAGEVGAMVARRLLDHREFGLAPVGFIDDEPMDLSERRVPVLVGLGAFERVVAEHRVEQLVITFSRAPHDLLISLAERARDWGLGVSVIPRLFERTTEHPELDQIGGMPLLHLRAANPHGWYFHLKYLIDRVMAVVLLVFCLPLLIAAAVAVWLSVGRPFLFRQVRVGLDGRHFVMLKFRTMRESRAEDHPLLLPADTAPGGVEGVDRTTRVGRLLRQTSIDELPQLVNVLRGEMSLVGPRPERPEFVEKFRTSVRGYDRRHRVKSGITGWAQVHGLRGQTSVSDRAEWDNYYIDNFSLWLDAKIVVLTAGSIIRNVFVRR